MSKISAISVDGKVDEVSPEKETSPSKGNHKPQRKHII